MTNDLRLIHTQGLDEGIRCAMCTNTIKSDKGCDGGCVVDQKMYEKVLEVIDKALELQPTKMRDATEEERKSVKDYVDAVSKPTGMNFNELLRDCRTCKHNTVIDCGQYPCNECNRKTLPLYEPKIAQPTSDDEIIKALKAVRTIHNGNYAPQIDEAIRRLEAQPCEDCISRSELLRHQHIIYDDDEEDYRAVYVKDIKAMPPVKPQIESSEDCINRTELTQKLNAWDSKAHGIPNYAWKVIREMPSVTPTNEDIKEAYLKGYDYGVKDWFDRRWI